MRVFNRHIHDVPSSAVYVGRGTPYGNPYSSTQDVPAHLRTNSREESVSLFEDWLKERIAEDPSFLDHLRGKDLVCSCVPKPCHATILLRYANEDR